MINDKKTYIIIILSLIIIIFGLLWGRSYQYNKQYRYTIAELRNRINSYSEINQQLSEENQQFAGTIKELREQLGKYQSKIRQAREIVTGLQNDTTKISGKLSSIILTIRKIEKELQKVKKVLTDNNRS